MNPMTLVELKALLRLSGKPCLSIFSPTHPGGSEQDPILWKQLVKDAERSLEAWGMRGSGMHDMLKPATHVLHDPRFWKSASQGLACFVTPSSVRWYRLAQPVAAQVKVANTFHVKPLLPLLENATAFWVLAISQNRVQLWRGDAESLHEVAVAGLPRSMEEAMRLHDRDEVLNYHTRRTGGVWSAIFHGQGVGIDDFKGDLLRFFQMIDQGLHGVLKQDKKPLILASVEYLWPIYQQANHYSHLLAHGIAGNPDKWKPSELHERACTVLSASFTPPSAKGVALFERLWGTGRTCVDPREVAEDGCLGKLEYLFVPLDRELHSVPEADQQRPRDAAAASNTEEDLYNQAAIRTLCAEGKVYALPAKDIPGGNGQAGIYWLPLAKHR